jgi:hypothetical protein
VTAIREISPRLVATKGHNNDLSISPTSLIRTHVHQLLNIQQSECFEDRKQLVLHIILLAPGIRCAHWYKCAFVLPGTICAGVRSIP